MSTADNNIRPPFDSVLLETADYVSDHVINNEEAMQTARYCLLDSLGCAIQALQHEECRRHIGPIVPGATLKNGARVPGTQHELDPMQAAFNIGVLVRWLDYNDTWLAAEWGHPSDNLGAILACADYLNRQGRKQLTMQEVLEAMVKTYEIQGIMALENSFNQVGIDHVILVKVASTAIATWMLGGDREAITNALSNAWADGGTLRAYRHAPNTGWRKSWAAGDATSRAVRLALMSCDGEMGYPSTLSAPHWGFYDVMFKGRPFKLARPFGSYVMENILFKVAYPVEFHAQTAVECAIRLHDKVIGRLDEIDHIELSTQEAAMRIINKSGPLHNPADRDHSLQYAVAIGLLFGGLESHHYSNEVAADPRIDELRVKMHASENKAYTQDYFDPDKRAIAKTVTVNFSDGTMEQAAVEYPVGHRRRREEARPLLEAKFRSSLELHYDDKTVEQLCSLMLDHERLLAMPVDEFMGLWVVS